MKEVSPNVLARFAPFKNFQTNLAIKQVRKVLGGGAGTLLSQKVHSCKNIKFPCKNYLVDHFGKRTQKGSESIAAIPFRANIICRYGNLSVAQIEKRSETRTKQTNFAIKMCVKFLKGCGGTSFKKFPHKNITLTKLMLKKFPP